MFIVYDKAYLLIILTDSPISVICTYSKGGGKNSAHAWVPETDSIGKLVLQVYEHIFRGKFRAVPQQMSKLYAIQFLHIPPHSWLCRLPQPPPSSRGPMEPIELDVASLDWFNKLSESGGLNDIQKAVQSLSVVQWQGGMGEMGAEQE